MTNTIPSEYNLCRISRVTYSFVGTLRLLWKSCGLESLGICIPPVTTSLPTAPGLGRWEGSYIYMGHELLWDSPAQL